MDKNLNKILQHLQSLKDEVSDLKLRVQKLENNNTQLETKVVKTQPQSLRSKQTPNFSNKSISTNKSNFETNLGVKGFGLIGILALALSISFFIKYAIDNNWIDMLTRIILSFIFGIGVYFLGLFTLKYEKYKKWAQIITSGGILITYITTYNLYHLNTFRNLINISLNIDILLLLIISCISIITAIKLNSQIFAIGAFVLSFIAIFNTQPIDILTAFYVLLISLGINFISIIKKWNILNFLGIFGYFLIYITSLPRTTIYPDVLTSTLFILTFISYNLGSIHSLDKASKQSYKIQTISIVLNSLLFTGLGVLFFRLTKDIEVANWLISIAIAHFGTWLILKGRQENQISSNYFYIGLGLFTLSISKYFNDNLQNLFWSLELIILAITAKIFKKKELYYSGYLLSIIILFQSLKNIEHLQKWHQIFIQNQFQNISYLLVYIFIIIALHFFSWILSNTKLISKNEYDFLKFINIAANVLVILGSIRIASGFVLSGFWSIYAFALLNIGVLLRKRSIRLQGLVLFVITIIKVFTFDISNLDTLYRFISFLILGLILIITSLFYSKYKDKFNQLL